MQASRAPVLQEPVSVRVLQGLAQAPVLQEPVSEPEQPKPEPEPELEPVSEPVSEPEQPKPELDEEQAPVLVLLMVQQRTASAPTPPASSTRAVQWVLSSY